MSFRLGKSPRLPSDSRYCNLGTAGQLLCPQVVVMPEATLVEPMQAAPPLVAAGAANALAAAGQAKIDGAVAFLNNALRDSGVQLAVTVSDYVVQTFFGGDPKHLSSHDRTRAVTYGALCARKDLEMGAATLRRLVRIGLQVKELPAELAHELTPGQHRALLVVDSLEHKLELARATVAGQWTAEKLEEVISVERRKPEGEVKAGRPSKARLVKAAAAVTKAALALGAAEAFAVELAALSEADRAAVLLELRVMVGFLGPLVV